MPRSWGAPTRIQSGYHELPDGKRLKAQTQGPRKLKASKFDHKPVNVTPAANSTGSSLWSKFPLRRTIWWCLHLKLNVSESGEQKADLQSKKTEVLRSLTKMSPGSLCTWWSCLTGPQHNYTYVNWVNVFLPTGGVIRKPLMRYSNTTTTIV